MNSHIRRVNSSVNSKKTLHNSRIHEFMIHVSWNSLAPLQPCATRQLDGWCALQRRARAAGARLAEAKLRVVLHVSRVVCVCVCVPALSMHVHEGSASGGNGFFT